MRTAKRITYFDLDELNDASRLLEQKVEDAERLLTKEEGLFRKFKKLVPKVEKVTKSLEDAAKNIGDLQETVLEEMTEAGGLKGQGVAASELVRIAKELMADAYEGFSVMKPIKFKPNAGTRNCLDNAKMIKEAGYELVGGYFKYDTNKGDYLTTAFFSRGQQETQQMEFRGFSIGYGGEGPHGMMEFGRMFGWNFKEENVFGRAMVEAADPGTVRLTEL